MMSLADVTHCVCRILCGEYLLGVCQWWNQSCTVIPVCIPYIYPTALWLPLHWSLFVGVLHYCGIQLCEVLNAEVVDAKVHLFTWLITGTLSLTRLLRLNSAEQPVWGTVTPSYWLGISVVAHQCGVLMDVNLLVCVCIHFPCTSVCMQCESLPAVRAFIDNLDPQKNRTFHMVLGPGCSSGATVVAPLANAWNLTTVSTGVQ